MMTSVGRTLLLALASVPAALVAQPAPILAPAAPAIPVPPSAVAFVEALPAYTPAEKVTGHISLWGHGSFRRDFMGKLVARWIAEFRRAQPGVTFSNQMYGTASAIGALYTGAGQIALLGEEISPAAAAAFERARGYPPTGIQIATGSVDVNFFDYAHMIFVHRDNPLASLDLTQLDAIFGTERRRGAPNDLRSWGDLGLTGEWAARKIQPYGWKVDEDFALFFREAVLGHSHRWNPAIREYVHTTRPDGVQYDHGQQILDALAVDPAGIAISNVRYRRPEVKALALAPRPGTPAHAATPENLIAQSYPLVRLIPAYFDRAPGRPVEPSVREFLRYVLGREGQSALLAETGYLPLGPDANRAQLAVLATHEPPPGRTPPPPVAQAPLAVNQPGVGLPPPENNARPEVVRIAGSAALASLLSRWADAFQSHHPSLQVTLQLEGADVAMAALYTGGADLAILGRVPTDPELKAYEWIYRRKPAILEVATGGLHGAGQSPALVLFVHRDNPLASLTLTQIDALFSAERRRGGPAALKTWGDLGLSGAWADTPVRLYAPDMESGTGRFFRSTALNGSRRLHWDRITEFSDTLPGRPPSHDAPRRTIDALARDSTGLAVASLDAATPFVKPLTIDGVFPDRESVLSRRYALARAVNVCAHQAPGQHAATASFLRFILSEAGQAIIDARSGYLPLTEGSREAQRQRLD